MRRSISRLIFLCILIAAPAVLAADNPPLTDTELHAAYCAGAHQAHEAELGDVCIEARAGTQNACSADIGEESRLLAALTAEQSITKAGVGEAIVSGQNGYKQCISEAASGPAQPTCKRLRDCDD
jgi:hypothetical protein